ncbi:hypothetical protein BH18ACI2_BH18ACI2_09160 [soil metagenome]
MTVRKIVEYPAKILAIAGEPVTAFDEQLKTLVEDMF